MIIILYTATYSIYCYTVYLLCYMKPLFVIDNNKSFHKWMITIIARKASANTSTLFELGILEKVKLKKQFHNKMIKI